MRLKYNIIYLANKLLRHNYPCGRTKKDSYLCCRRELNYNTIFFSDDRKKAYCKYCGTIRMLSNEPIENLW